MHLNDAIPTGTDGSDPNELLSAAYKQMARDRTYEAEALEWAEASLGDVADDGQ